MQTQRAILDIRLGFVGPLLPPAKEQQPLIDGLCRPLQACCDGNRGLASRAQFEQPAVLHVLFLFRSMTGCQFAFRLAGDLVAFAFLAVFDGFSAAGVRAPPSMLARNASIRFVDVARADFFAAAIG
jgi:hypothetical protein